MIGAEILKQLLKKTDASSLGEKMYITDIRCKNADRCRRMHEQIVR